VTEKKGVMERSTNKPSWGKLNGLKSEQGESGRDRFSETSRVFLRSELVQTFLPRKYFECSNYRHVASSPELTGRE
jgi:hypothetical protein